MSQAPGAQPSPPSVYHERQRLELCAVHALNNVLQQQLFSQEAADEICKRAFLAAALAQGLCEVLLVVTKEVEEKGCWLQTD
uniref:ubiquitinyl hydrolase 1 n=1 Tax=Spermophilus dauricus TaxID=99837 RepID=A0A8C9PRS0_SPEDA